MVTRKDAEKWVEELPTTKKPDPKEMSDAAYTLSELGGFFPDAVDSVSPEMLVFCWRVVESVRVNGFPEHLRI